MGCPVAGGTVEEPIGRRNRRAHDRLARWAASLDDPVERLRAALSFRGAASVAELARYCQLTKESAAALLEAMTADGELAVLPGGAFALERSVSEGADNLLSALAGMHEAQPLLTALPVAEVRDRAGLDEATLAVVLERLGGDIIVEGRTIRAATHEVRLDPALKDAADQLLDCLRQARFKPPFRDGLADAAALSVGDLTKALTFLKDQGTVREVAAGLLYGTEQLDEGLRLLRAVSQKRGSFEPVDAKAALGGISRKWLIPMLEYYDRLGATRRDGNERRLTPKGEQMAKNGIGGA